ncbi:MAG TPA: hypothetical protein VGX91_04520 [Candidatus Cybelea sp.]|nr:hypothetical protein [Candidatus Cybelea sp.]
MLSGVLAALWLLGLYAAAPVLQTGRPYEFVDRLRDALILGVAIPLGLGAVALLYPTACFAVLVLCIAFATLRRRAAPHANPRERAAPPYLLIAALFAVAWPQLMRPLLDGDSLSYHLPNAAAWTQAHSLWTTAARYWWYPPASELFASGLYATGGPYALPWGGFGALALLGFRIARWARDCGATPLLGDALAAAAVTAFPLAIQGGTLQNDAWLAAFWIESLWALREARTAAATRALAVTALIKPQGWLFAILALLSSKARLKLWLVPLLALGAWLAHDLLLLPTASISPSAGSAYGDPLSSTIVAHGFPALALLVRVTAGVSPFALLALCAALFGLLFARADRRLAWAALGALAVFLVLPFGYQTTVPQLATGESLRFAAPAIAAGTLLLARPAARAPALAVALLIASTLYGVWYVLAIFWNDGSTHVAPVVALLAAGIAAATYRRTAWPLALALGASVVVATHLAARHALDYYDDALSVDGVQPGIYRWIASKHPPAIGGEGLRLGVVNVLSPSTRTRDLLDAGACATAHRSGTLLVAVAQNDLPPGANARRLTEARACGQTLYSDAIGVVVLPGRGP